MFAKIDTRSVEDMSFRGDGPYFNIWSKLIMHLVIMSILGFKACSFRATLRSKFGSLNGGISAIALFVS